MDQWLRPVFARTRTPIPSTPNPNDSTSEPHDPEDCSKDKDTSKEKEKEKEMKSIRPSSRVSSYIGFRTSSSTNLNSNSHSHSNSNSNHHTLSTINPDPPTFHINIPENTYHKPSGSQMAETLKVVMMTRNLGEAVPVEYNSCILHVLESYNDLRELVGVKEREIAEIGRRHAEVLREFEGLAEE